MNEQQFVALVETVGPDGLLTLIEMLEQLTPEELQQLKAQLAQMIQGGEGQGQPAPAPDQGSTNLYG